jgi:hypothetical protein
MAFLACDENASRFCDLPARFFKGANVEQKSDPPRLAKTAASS